MYGTIQEVFFKLFSADHTHTYMEWDLYACASGRLSTQFILEGYTGMVAVWRERYEDHDVPADDPDAHIICRQHPENWLVPLHRRLKHLFFCMAALDVQPGR